MLYHLTDLLVTPAVSSGKRNVMGWYPFVCLSVCLSICLCRLFSITLQRIVNVTHQREVCDAAWYISA